MIPQRFPINKVAARPPRYTIKPPRAFASADIIQASDVIGKGIILFTGFYCTLNYMYYKELREKIEKRKDDSDQKDKPSK